MAQEENEQTTEATKCAKEIEKKVKQGYLDEMKKTWREKLHISSTGPKSSNTILSSKDP